MNKTKNGNPKKSVLNMYIQRVDKAKRNREHFIPVYSLYLQRTIFYGVPTI